ncbi:MAG: AAA family ATPase [Campylobacterales bacterium]|nr:AAA family ATPase [Campylobacterales bacterium]
MKTPETIIQQILDETQSIILGKEQQIKLSLCAYLAGVHVLIEDIPGVGKTTLAKTLARVLGLEYSRIQFTSDLLPSDIIGINVFNPKEGNFSFKKGAVFSQFLLADEINRASSKTQSALLEAMEERQVSVDGVAYPLPRPFFVIATKNPNEEIGTYELPSSQLDRFALSFALGYPDAEAERKMLMASHRPPIETLLSLEPGERQMLQERYDRVHVSAPIIDMVQEILKFTRESSLYRTGLSPRAALTLLAVSKGWAMVSLREYVIPSDVLAILPFIISHRLRPLGESKTALEMADDIVHNLTIDT